MDLREFISTTILSINDALIDIENKKGGTYGLAEDIRRKDGVDFGTVHFDVAVTASDETSSIAEGKGKVAIKVVSVEGGKNTISSSKDTNSSRISFDLTQIVEEDRKYSDEANVST